MSNYIKYKRFEECIDKEKFDEFFDTFIRGGWEIIYYNESEVATTDWKEECSTGFRTPIQKIKIVVVAGKTGNLIKNIL